MKQISLLLLLILSLSSCSRKDQVTSVPEDQIIEVHYDTTAIDSFSPGAVNIDIARKIKMASKKYQDSTANVLRMEQERKLQLEIEKLKEEQRKQEEEKVKKESQRQENITSENITT